MKANPGLATSLRLATGGGGAGTMYLDGLRVAPYGQLNSWEASLEGWSVPNTNFTSGGFSTTDGASAGLYSWVVQNTTGTMCGIRMGPPRSEGPSSTVLTELLAKATNVTMTVYFPTNAPYTGNFGWGVGFSLYLNQPGGAGILPISKWENWSTLGITNTLPSRFRRQSEPRCLTILRCPAPCVWRRAAAAPERRFLTTFSSAFCLPPRPASGFANFGMASAATKFPRT